MDILQRRRFLQSLGLAGGAVCGASLLRRVRAADPLPAPRRVVVVGAGLAGLVAAYELEQKGHTVTILEADPDHAGGRVRTRRFGNDRYGELGAMRIPKNHDLPRRYAKAFGLELRPFVQDNPEAYYFARGKKVRQKDWAALATEYKLAEWERGKSPEALWERSVNEVWKKLTPGEKDDLSAVYPRTAAVRDLDRLSLRQLFERAGMSDEAIEYVAVTYAEETLFHTAATEVLRDEMLGVYAGGLSEIKGGMDLLPKAFVKRLKSKPRFGCEVTEVRRRADPGGVEAHFTEAGKPQKVEADYLICTVPFAVLGRIRFVPALSPEKQRAIRVLHYESGTKVLLNCRSRFWEQAPDGIFGGGTITDLPTGMTYYPSDNAEAKDPKVSAAGGVLLASYSWGLTARRAAAGADPVRRTARHLSAVHPQLADPNMVQNGEVWDWDRHPWSGGAFSWFMPGQHTELHRHILEPEGRVLLAGEHASLAHSWTQGAMESGLRAVEVVLNNGKVPE